MQTPITAANASAFARNVVATLLAVGTFATIAWFWIGPRVTDWAQRELGTDQMVEAIERIESTQAAQADTQRQQQQTIATISDTQSRTADTLNAVVERIAALEKTGRADRVQPIRFLEADNTITSAAIGDFVRFEFRYIKTRDCGRPVSVAYFRNGGGIVHAFRNKSSTAEDGRSASGVVSPEVQVMRFIARIPSDENVQPTGEGYATGWILMSWPDCPNASELRSPIVPFRILPPKG